MKDVAPSRAPSPLRPSPTPSDEFTSILNLFESTQADDVRAKIGHCANGVRPSASWLSVPDAGLDVRSTSAGGTTTVRFRTIQANTVNAYSGPDAMGSLLPGPIVMRKLVVVECGNIVFHNLAQLDLLAQVVERANLVSTPCVIAGLDSRCRHLLVRWWPESGLRLVGHICGNPALFGPA